MTSYRRACLWVSSLLVLSAASAFAQSDATASTAPPPAHLSLIEGRVLVDREGRSDTAVANLPLLDGDRLRTLDGRAEVILADGSLLHLDRDTTVDVMAADLLRLLDGRVYVIGRGARDPQRAVRYQIDAPVASVQTGGPGEFRVWSAESARGREVELAVFRGQATLASSSGAETLRAGERAVVRDGLAPSAPQYFNSALWDEFDRWSAARRNELLGAASAQYLPSELAVYSRTFDQYGTWRSDPEEGAVWYPSVAVDWRPYTIGYWRTYPAWGSFWVASDPWGWPTHHYGHWGFSLNFGWYWKPAPLWGPAWVYWAYSPGFVSWCPLGRFGVPVFGHFGVPGRFDGRHYDPWRGWTVVPRHSFGAPVPVHRVAVDGRRLDPGARGSFAAHRDAPGVNRAVPRPGSGGMAVPRPGTGGMAVPRYAGSGSSIGPSGNAPLARPRPDDAARVLAGGGEPSAGAATRRRLPPAPSLGAAATRTEAPPATPDVAAFGNRRYGTAVPRDQVRTGSPTQFGDGAPTRFGNGSPTRFGNGSPAQFGSGAPTQFGGSARTRDYPRAAPAPDADRGYTAPPRSGYAQPRSRESTMDGTAAPPAVRQNPYVRGDASGGGGLSAGQPRAYPRYGEPQSGSPRYTAPSSGEPPRQSAPRDNPYSRGGGMPAGPSARPRDGGSSAPAGAPRYNPGSGASQPRGGSASPPPQRRRDRSPD